MKNKLLLGFLLMVCFSSITLAAYKETANVKVKLVSVWASSGGILVQTYPKPDISGLTCTNDYWLILNPDQLGYQAGVSMLLAAQAAQVSVTVRAEDNNGSEFCLLSRVITIAD